jgi:hypothetical protein
MGGSQLTTAVNFLKGFARFWLAFGWMLLEDLGIGRRLYFLPFPRDRQEVSAYPKRMFSIAQSCGAVPTKAVFSSLSLPPLDEGVMSDPGKFNRTFVFTLHYTFGVKAGSESSTTLYIKTGRMRAPAVAQLYFAVKGGAASPATRECAFYTNIAPTLSQAARVPKCYMASQVTLLTHSFYLLEAILNVTASRDAVGPTNEQAQAFVQELALVHKQYRGVDPQQQPLLSLGGNSFVDIFETNLPQPHRPLAKAVSTA